MDIYDGTIPLPFGMLVIGSPMNGKSYFMRQLIIHRKRIFRDTIDYICYFYGQESATVREIRESLPEVLLIHGLPDDFADYIKDRGNAIFFFDDLMDCASSSKEMLDLVTNKCQHKSISWVLCLQNAFHSGSARVSITRAAHLMVIFDSKLDRTIPRILAQRIMPENPRAFLSVFEDATSRQFGYLLCDGHPRSDSALRLRTNLFDTGQIIYRV